MERKKLQGAAEVSGVMVAVAEAAGWAETAGWGEGKERAEVG